MGLFRLILALAVVLGHAHAGFRPMNGGLAVQAFFVISGFYMALILDGKYAHATSTFYTNRVLRLFPSYLIILALSLFALLAFNINEYIDRETFLNLLADPRTAPALIAANFFIIGQDIISWFDVAPGSGFIADLTFRRTGEFQPAWTMLLIPQSWSLAFELMFYAMAPFLARRKLWVLILVAAASICVRNLGFHIDADIAYYLWPRRAFPADLYLFIFGMISYRGLALAERIPQRVRIGVTLAVAIVLLAHSSLPINGQAGRWLIYLLFPLVAPIAFLATGRNRVDRTIGDLSYPIYISHVLVIAVVQAIDPPFALGFILFGVFLVSALLLYFVDWPIDRWRQTRLTSVSVGVTENRSQPGAPKTAS